MRLWIAGCSTGEEVYSIAICLLELFAGQPREPAIQIFGTDASERSIERARLRIYPDSLASEISPERLRRFFLKTERGYQIAKRVRDLCIFARQNLCNDPPFSKLDLVSCRNVLIYMQPELQKQIILTFHSVAPQRLPVAGQHGDDQRMAEDIPTDPRHNFYARTGETTGHRAAVSLRVRSPESRGASLSPSGQYETGDAELQRAADRLVVARFGPPGVVLNEHMEILQARGHTAPYLEMSPGTASFHLLRNVHPSIALPVRASVCRAIELDTPVRPKISSSWMEITGIWSCWR